MNKKALIILFLFITILVVYIVFNVKFISCTTIWIIFIMTALMDSIYLFGNQKYSKLLLLSTLLSTIMFGSYIYIAIQANEPSNVGDFSILPIILFMVSFPFIVATHSVVLIKSLFKSNTSV
jgi:hypothetical protein